ncbi:hypothetical protein KEU06_24130 [Pseudaminobacter sp. 19-2017]|uniref:Uncharacterized protein n=1 Tax=Pseudaminobacter soli (ex Zhang et al. 2022) TaxID=2831468 RepID=A0A942E2F1_9HYPH|nr:hypothetical protein [Pseudaminobacter soli]
MEWIAQHQQVITALTGLGTLIVWVVYLQVFVSSYRRQLRATLLITRGAGDGLEARCLLSNMSSGPVYVQSVLVTLGTPKNTFVSPVTDMPGSENGASADLRERTRQGPLASGETRDIGSFRNLIEHALRGTQVGSNDGIASLAIRLVTVEVVGIYGSEDLPIGARRCFLVVEEKGQLRVRGQALKTQQIRARGQRRRLLIDLARDR